MLLKPTTNLRKTPALLSRYVSRLFLTPASANTVTPMSDFENSANRVAHPEPHRLRSNLRLMTADATSFNVMVGIGETYFTFFALALGQGELISGLIATVPMLAGATLQLISPYEIGRASCRERV